MRHRSKKAILNRPADQRKAMMRNLMTSLFLEGALKTTDAKARALSSAAEKLITLVKGKEEYQAIRELMSVVHTKASSHKALEYIKSSTRTSGYTRLTKIGRRAGDGALMVQVELIPDTPSA